MENKFIKNKMSFKNLDFPKKKKKTRKINNLNSIKMKTFEVMIKIKVK